jgi:hypothetical protein
LPLLERVRVEIHLPKLSQPQYRNLLRSFEQELTYAFGGCTIVSGLEGSYLSDAGECILDWINLIYSDAPLRLSTNFDVINAYAGELRDAAMEALSEEAVLVSVERVYHPS